jgi:hypothetical protein
MYVVMTRSLSIMLKVVRFFWLTTKCALLVLHGWIDMSTGVLMLPKGAQSAGFVAGAVTLIFCGVLCLISMLMLLSARKHYEEAVAQGWLTLDGYDGPPATAAGTEA